MHGSDEAFAEQPEARARLGLHIRARTAWINITILDLGAETKAIIEPDVVFFGFVNAYGNAAETTGFQMSKNSFHQLAAQSFSAIFFLYAKGTQIRR